MGHDGLMDAVRLIALRGAPLSVDEVISAVAGPAAGGIAVFIGAVRDHDGGRDVTALEYTAHPTAEARLREVAEKTAASHPEVTLAATHRVGDLRVGDLAVVVAAASPHRAEAFAACRAFIDELKREVPIWKHETFGGGDAVWIGV